MLIGREFVNVIYNYFLGISVLTRVPFEDGLSVPITGVLAKLPKSYFTLLLSGCSHSKVLSRVNRRRVIMDWNKDKNKEMLGPLD